MGGGRCGSVASQPAGGSVVHHRVDAGGFSQPRAHVNAQIRRLPVAIVSLAVAVVLAGVLAVYLVDAGNVLGLSDRLHG